MIVIAAPPVYSNYLTYYCKNAIKRQCSDHLTEYILRRFENVRFLNFVGAVYSGLSHRDVAKTHREPEDDRP